MSLLPFLPRKLKKKRATLPTADFWKLLYRLTSEVKESVVPLNSECATSVIVEGTHMLPCEVPDLLGINLSSVAILLILPYYSPWSDEIDKSCE